MVTRVMCYGECYVCDGSVIEIWEEASDFGGSVRDSLWCSVNLVKKPGEQ